MLKSKKRSGWMHNFARKLVLSRLKKLQHGKLIVVEKAETYFFGNGEELSATITINDEHFYGEIAFGGSIGAGEAYMLNYWACR